MGSSIHQGAGEMCLEAAAGGRRRGGKKQVAAAAEQKVPKQPQRGLGVAQLEKIRMQNQMIAAYRSGGLPPPPSQQHQQHVHFAAAAGPPPVSAAAAASSFQPSYLTGCFEAMDHRRIAADVQYRQYYAENLLPYGSSRPPAATSPMYVVPHDAKDSSPSGHMQQMPLPPQYDYWSRSSGHELSGGAGSTEELDLELRL